ncbi:MAG: hypothetical protein IBX71_03210 [Candidatus Desulforudis sp.]|nr:hypothetical protein [Desulforudis sp.]
MSRVKPLLIGGIVFAFLLAAAGCIYSGLPNDGRPAEAETARVVFTVNPLFPPENPDFRDDVFSVRIDGTGFRRLTETGDAGEARFSPDGGLILYARHHDAAAFNYYLMDGDGSNQRLLTPEPVSGRVCWAPEAGLLLHDYYERERREWRLVLVAVGDGSRSEIPLPPGDMISYYLSPDGREVWIVVQESGLTSLYYRPLDAEVWREAAVDATLPAGAWLESVSMSGRYVLMGGLEDGNHYFGLFEREPGEPVLRQAGHWPRGAAHAWSEDDRLAYTTPSGIMVAEPGGGEPRLFWPREGITDHLLSWDGEAVIFTVRTPAEFLLAWTDGRQETELVRLGGAQ